MKTPLRGFTLIELLVVVVLIAVMLAIAVPSFASFISNYRVTTAMNEFLQGVTTTRMEALKRGRFVDMVPKNGTDWTSGWRLVVTSTAEVISEHGALPSSITVSSPTPSGLGDATNTYVAFDGTGYPKQHAVNSPPLIGGIVMVDTSATVTTSQHVMCLAAYGRPKTFTLATGVPDCSGG